MKGSLRPNLYVALIHYPVRNKKGDTIASAVTNLDLHDISRIARTYGAAAVYMVTPLADQQRLIKRIIDHWQTGLGASYNPLRRKALELIQVKATLDDVKNEISRETGESPKTIATCARPYPQNISFGRLREMLSSPVPYLLVLGTAWGLAEEIIAEADYVLAPIRGESDYNHLPVRAAAAVILDRLLGTRK